MSTCNGTAAKRRSKEEIVTAPEKPEACPVLYDNIPAELRERSQWVCWAYVRRDGRWTKVPKNPRTGANAEANDPTTWGTFEEACTYHQLHDDLVDGIGYVIAEDDPYTGVDVDDCFDGEAVKPDSAKILDALDSYTEESPTATGFKCIARGKKPGDRCKETRRDVEIYDRGRFFTVTGRHKSGCPDTIEDRQAEIEQLYNDLFDAKTAGQDKPKATWTGATDGWSDEQLLAKAKGAANGDKFAALWGGDTSRHNGDGSSADEALCCMLVFWCGPDKTRVDGLFRQSGLMRPKWDEVHHGDGRTYGEMTVGQALEYQHEYYSPKRGGASGQAQTFDLPPLQLRLGTARLTPSGKTTASVMVLRDGTTVNQFILTSALSGRKEVVRLLAGMVGGNDQATRTKIDAALGQIIAAATAQAEQAAQAVPEEGATIRDIVTQRVLADIRPAYRTAAGFYSETKGDDLRRQDFIVYTPSQLVDAAAEAVDAPRDFQNAVNRPSLVKAIQVELGVIYADLMRTLPVAADASLGVASNASKQFRAAMVRLWTIPGTWEQNKDGYTARASLASRVLLRTESRMRGGAAAETKAWNRILDACSAWWRIGDRDGELAPLLAMRWELMGQIKVDLPGVTGQRELYDLGVKFGCIDPNPPVSPFAGRGGMRLAVLTQKLTEHIVDVVSEFKDAPPDDAEACPDDAEGVPDDAG